MAGIYIHIPFCKQRCRYCAFYSSTMHDMRKRYIAAVCREIFMRRIYIIGERIDTIYFGGGTPSLLDENDLQNVLRGIGENHDIAPDAEMTLEGNPDDLTPEYLAMLRRVGFNRLSIGIQSLNDERLSALGRRHNADRARQAVRDARMAGFENISIDLMFALPKSTCEEWQRTLDSAIELRPTHISAYNLTYEEGTALHRGVTLGEIVPVSEDENIAQFELLINTMKRNGFRHYEISNFALPGFESRHNSSYWHDTPYIGCGAAAHSYDGKSRQWNISDVKGYIQGMECGQPRFEIEHLSETDKYNDAILTRLRTSDGLPVEWFREKFAAPFTEYMLRAAQPHIAAGRLQACDERIALTRSGIFVSDAIMRDLIYTD